jgi:hypothetical protein
MSLSTVAVLAGVASTALFMTSTLPMLAKAWRTRDLSSYSLGQLLLSNLGNAVYSVYVFSLPPGPIWALHCFYVATTLTMLLWFLRYGMGRNTHAASRGMRSSPDARDQVVLLASVASDNEEG